jgi:hypothetical protein
MEENFMNLMQTIETYPSNASPEEFPLTLAACRKADLNLWEIGDALIENVGDPLSMEYVMAAWKE